MLTGGPHRPRAALAGWAARLLRVRGLVRAPIWVYRAGLGSLFGVRLLMLEHTGRVSGIRRYVVLEVVDRRPGSYTVVSGFGDQAQWFRNVRADPRVRVWAGRRPEPATARLLTSDEAAAALSEYSVRHPRAWATLRPVLEATLGAPISERQTSLPMIALDLVRARS